MTRKTEPLSPHECMKTYEFKMVDIVRSEFLMILNVDDEA